MKNAVQSAIEEYGKLDIMVSNAGTMDRKIISGICSLQSHPKMQPEATF